MLPLQKRNICPLGKLMRSILKYIIPFLLLAFFWGSDNCAVSVNELHIIEKNAGYSTDDASSYSSGAENYICSPSVSLNNVSRGHNAVRRVDTGQRSGASFVKDGRIIRCNSYKKTFDISKLKSYSLSEPCHRLISLGKLII